MGRRWINNCPCESYDELVDRRIREEQRRQAAMEGETPTTLHGRLLRGARRAARRLR